ncbi:hypothetical protein F5B21DRAFT_121862 [Xylaria acuta]|nr:hypothetical protein F5B21DRAFT_121862 [Xylaria acuta]
MPPFPARLNLYATFSGFLKALTTHKICGASADDMLYLIQVHPGYTPRGPLHFGRGLYLRSGTSFNDPILTAAGEVFRLPLLVSLFDPKTAVLLPPLDREKNPRDKVTQVLHASAGKEHGVAFKFAIKVGAKTIQRVEFEWRKAVGKELEEPAHNGGSRYQLYRLAANSSTMPSSSSCSPQDGGTGVLAGLRFEHLVSFNHLFTLELKGAGVTGELGERWTLVVVMMALGIHWLRYNGKTKTATVKVAQIFNFK